ncbi:hypothetical protein GOP47_0011728 [Adiantum capillus-veneris]|uniref:Uncharacterized protein n=1 Tax=Adiantum capillus-veneris TaxID=13818 RepID=A0A9D4UTU9_ADICA|nr:hypothetical protein GOP47_0011728 [Adiantum capillus-veneris]
MCRHLLLGCSNGPCLAPKLASSTAPAVVGASEVPTAMPNLVDFVVDCYCRSALSEAHAAKTEVKSSQAGAQPRRFAVGRLCRDGSSRCTQLKSS